MYLLIYWKFGVLNCWNILSKALYWVVHLIQKWLIQILNWINVRSRWKARNAFSLTCNEQGKGFFKSGLPPSCWWRWHRASSHRQSSTIWSGISLGLSAKQFILLTDASATSIGAVLEQNGHTYCHICQQNTIGLRKKLQCYSERMFGNCVCFKTIKTLSLRCHFKT